MTTIYQFFSKARTRSSGFARVLSFLIIAMLCGVGANAQLSSCQGNEYTINASPAAAFAYNWQIQNPTTLNWSNAAGTRNGEDYTLDITYYGTANTYTFRRQRLTFNGWENASAVTVTIVATPATPTATNGGAVCTGGTISLSTPAVTNATYVWTGPGGYTASVRTPSRASATTAMAGTYNVTVTVNGCTSASGSTTVTVNQTPATPTATNSGAVCAGESITLFTPTVSGAAYAWTGPNGYSSSVQNPTIANATASMVGTYNVTVTVNGCTSATGSTTVPALNAATTAAITPSTTSAVCQNGTAPELTVAGTGTGTLTYAWFSNATNSNTGGSLIASATGATYTPSAATAGTTYYYATVTGTCGTTASNAVAVQIDPTSVGGTISGGTAVCAPNNSVTLTLAGNTGTVGQWQSSSDANFTSPSNIGATGQTYPTNNLTTTTYYRAEVKSGVCPTVYSDQAVITITPLVTAGTVSGTSSICYGTPTQFTTTGTTGGTWSSANSGVATVSAIGEVTAVGAGTTNIVYTVTSPTCGGVATASAPVTVLNNIQGTIISAGNVVLCKGQNPSIVLNLTGTPTFSGTFSIFKVEGNVETAAGTHNFTATNSGNGIAVILPNTSIPNETNQMVTYVVRLTSLIDATNINSASCAALPTSLGGQVYLDVYPTPIMTAVLTSDATLCTTGNVSITTTNTNSVPATYKVTAAYPTGVTGNVPALGTPGQAFGTFNDVLVSSALTAPATVTYIFTPIANGTGGCNGDPKTVSVIVNPTPAVNTVNDVVVCENAAGTTSVMFSGNVANGTYTWEQTNAASVNIGSQATGTGNLSFTAENAGGTQLIANFTVTPSIGACAGTPEMFNIVVNPTATIGTVTAPTQICETQAGNSSVVIDGLLENASIHFMYNVTGDLTNTAQIGAPNAPNGSLTFSPASFGLNAPGTYTVTLTSVRASFDLSQPTFVNCPEVAINESFTITINPTPTFTAITAPATVCENNLTGDIVITGLLAGEDNTINYNITGETTEQSFTIPAANLTGTTATLPLALLNTPTPGSYTVTVNSVAANGCETDVTTNNTFTTTIYPTPTFTSIAAPATVCENNLVGNIVISGLTNGVENTLTYNITNGNNPMTMAIPAIAIVNGTATLPLSALSTPTPGTYEVNVLSVSTNGCVKMIEAATGTSFTTTIYPTPTFGELASALDNVCIDALSTATFTMDNLLPSVATTFHYDVFYNGGTTPITSNIDTLDANASGIASFDASMFSGVVPGTYMIQINKVVVNGCETMVTTDNTVTLNVNEAPEFATTTFAPTAFAIGCLTEVVYTVPQLVNVSAVPTDYTYTASGPNSFTSTGNGTGTGVAFPIGTSTVTVTATNDCGNDELTFDVVVTDTTAPVLTVINNTLTLNVGAGAGCTVPMPNYITGALANVTVENHCASNTITLTQLSPNDIDDDVIGYGGTRTVYISAADEYGNADTVSFTLLLVDATAPTVNTQNITVQLDAAGNASITPAQVNNNSVDNCTPVTLVSVSPSTFTCANIGTPVTVTLTVKDALNNTSTGTAIVTVADTVKPMLPVLADTTVAKGPLCTNTLGDFKHRLPASMYSTFDACGILSVTQSPSATAIIAANTASVNVTLTVTDVNNNVSTRSFLVNYTDQTAPKFVTAPTTIVRSNDAGTCGAVVTWTMPTATDNCTDIAPPTVTQTAGPVSGTVFAVGTTTSITYQANDGRGNTYDSTFTITVNDTELPTITNLPTSMTIATTSGCTAIASWPAVVGADNCVLPANAVTYTTSPTANLMNGDAFPTGVTTVMYTVVDAANNQTSGEFTVTVIDDVDPVINNIPANIVTTPNTTGCGAIVTWTAPTFTDCDQANTTMVSTHAPGFVFPVGVTTVTYTATDASSNVSTASFTVTVNNNLVGGVVGTSTVSQNTSTTSNVTFYATGGTAPYTFTYKVNNGPTQTISTTGTSAVVTTPQSNAVLGSFNYVLLSVTSNATNCVGTIAPANDDATITVIPFVPAADLVPTIDIASVNFSSSTTTQPYTLYIDNVGNTATTGSVSVRLSVPVSGAFDYTLGAGSASTWTITPGAIVGGNPIFYTLTSNGPLSITEGGSTAVSINLNKIGMVAPGSKTVANSVLPTAGETNTSNNSTSVRIFIAQ